MDEKIFWCSVLGFREDRFQWLQSFPPDRRCLHTDRYWANLALEIYDDEGDTFSEMGFAEFRARELDSWLAQNPLRKHQSLLYWAQCYIDMVFDREERDLVDLENVHRVTVPCEFEIPTGDDDDDEITLFHGTTQASAQDIRVNRISLGRGCVNQPLSDGLGFYLTPHSERAISTSFSKHPCTKVGPCGALIVFGIPKILFDEFEGLSLLDEEADSLHTYFRCGSPILLRIKNERLLNHYERSDYVSDPSGQICIISNKMAKAVSLCITSITFFDQ